MRSSLLAKYVFLICFICIILAFVKNNLTVPKFLERKYDAKEEKYRRKLKKVKKQFEEFKSSEKAELFELREANRALEIALLQQNLMGKEEEIESLKPKLPVREAGVRKWDRKSKLIFIHIGKAGGTSFAAMMAKELGKTDFYGAKHFDWTYVEEEYPAEEVLTLFREPVSRTISHFNFMKKLSWTKGMKIKEQSFDEFLEDKPSMMEFRGCWQDGQAGVSWLTGTHIAKWVKKGEHAEKDPDMIERVFFNYEKQLTEAADKIDKMFWFGILEDLDRSLELLAFQLDKPVNRLRKITNQNLHKIEPSLPSEKSAKFLRDLMPQDIWLYDYAKRVFEARWLFYKTKIYQHPKRPVFPKIICKSTRFILRCDGTQNDFIFKWDEKITEEHAKNFKDLLQ